MGWDEMRLDWIGWGGVGCGMITELIHNLVLLCNPFHFSHMTGLVIRHPHFDSQRGSH